LLNRLWPDGSGRVTACAIGREINSPLFGS
jgi:hypothetical protein